MAPRDSRSKFLSDLVSDSEQARYWAEHCGWEPGTGYCRNHRSPECRNQCSFRHLRHAEAEQIRRTRQQRRPTRQ